MSRILQTPPLRQKGVDFKSRRVDDHKLQTWIGRDYVIWVIFDEQGTAVGVYLLEPYPDDFDDRSLIQRFLVLFGA